ncbi:MAG: hypothetical protein OEW69_09240 [Nitrospirota bacterium]|nr:hypothetical protein [Nitrospirota bacterium]
MYCKRPINSKRVRKIEGSFSWIDHRFVTSGFIRELSTLEILLYFFLISVSDRNGISFYHDDRICSLLKIDLFSLGRAREALISRSLVAYDPPLYQVLSLPKRPLTLREDEVEKRGFKRKLGYIQKMKEVLK